MEPEGKKEATGSECRHSAELFWAEGVEVWGVAPKGVTEPGAVPGHLPMVPAAPRTPAHRDCPSIEFPA